ncbi:hypothetical protein VNO77_44380 [Canavalia gladiata]|uniref:Uncharacterized protein n=1 Tax=Canavalia gladiata TaxID=3824 RepID=A0AAN9PNS1_CANGL
MTVSDLILEESGGFFLPCSNKRISRESKGSQREILREIEKSGETKRSLREIRERNKQGLLMPKLNFMGSTNFGDEPKDTIETQNCLMENLGWLHLEDGFNLIQSHSLTNLHHPITTEDFFPPSLDPQVDPSIGVVDPIIVDSDPSYGSIPKSSLGPIKPYPHEMFYFGLEEKIFEGKKLVLQLQLVSPFLNCLLSISAMPISVFDRRLTSSSLPAISATASFIFFFTIELQPTVCAFDDGKSKLSIGSYRIRPFFPVLYTSFQSSSPTLSTSDPGG